MIGFKHQVEGAIAWRGPDVDYKTEGMHVLTTKEIAEIDAALRHLRFLGEVDFNSITPTTFPLPVLGEQLTKAGRDLRSGRGFLLLRGLPRERYAEDDLARIYFGLGSYIGRSIPQSHNGELLGHVMDVSDIEQHGRGYRIGGGQDMHTDSCDIVALLCLRAAKSGGISRIASVAGIHNYLVQHRPDLLKVLYGDYVFRRIEKDAEFGSGELVKKVVIFSRESGDFTCNIQPNYPRRAVAAGDSAMTGEQIEALDELQRLASSPDFYLDMSIGEGDIQFLNNRALLHGRLDYEDHPELARRRHMMRLWLSMPTWPAMPANQMMHTSEDHRRWLERRQPFMELPSRYLAMMNERLSRKRAS